MMKNNLFYGLALLTLNYSCAKVNSQEANTTIKAQDSVYVGQTHFSDDWVREDEQYTSILRVDKQNNGDYILSVQMNLKNNSYFVSPNENKDFSGKFKIVLTEPDKLIANGIILEYPLSKADVYHGNVKWVRENTNYKQTLKVLTKDDFEVSGFLHFTIEPRCTLEKVIFILFQKDGKLEMKMDGC